MVKNGGQSLVHHGSCCFVMFRSQKWSRLFLTGVMKMISNGSGSSKRVWPTIVRLTTVKNIRLMITPTIG